VRVVKSFAAERFEAVRLGAILRKVLRVNVKYGAYKHAEEPARTAVGYVVEAGIVLLAARELLGGRLAVPAFVLFLFVGRAVRKGEIVALVGPRGVGKSTLADLILRLYDPVSGAVTIDDRDLRTLRQEPYRRLFGVVPQEALLFNATIRENIAYGRENLTDADIMRAAQIANAHDFIGEFPDGYETVAGDRGVRLSGGQRQRVA